MSFEKLFFFFRKFPKYVSCPSLMTLHYKNLLIVIYSLYHLYGPQLMLSYGSLLGLLLMVP